MIARRFLSIIPKCPPPVYDTGCTYCSIPEFPKDKQIDFNKNLKGTSATPWKYLMVLSHGVKTFDEMPSKIEFLPESLAMSIDGVRRGLLSPEHPVMVSNVIVDNKDHLDVPSESDVPKDVPSKSELVYIYPDRKIVQFKKEDVVDFVKKYLVPETQSPVYNPFVKEQTAQESYDPKFDYKFKESTVNKDLVLICGHTQRDIRCGELAPLLKNEFSLVIKKESLDVDIGLISHVGGHAYAGNVIYLPKDGEIVWYGRVFPENVQGIVQETIIGKKIIGEFYRGQVGA